MACAMIPLDEQEVTEATGPLGKERTMPALHPDRKEERCFVPYKPPPEDSSPAQVEEYLEHGKFITEDLDWLLALRHDKFWCQVVFDESLQKCLDSYLCHAPRGLDPSSLPSSPAVADMQRCVHRAVFMTFLRMATHKESKESFITPTVFGEIIYNNFLFDIPKILDLCVLFGKGNSQLLHKMIENIFTQQPCYYGDLDEAVISVLQVRNTILAKCGLQCEGATAIEPLKLSSPGRPTAMTMSQQDLVDLVLYLCDTCTTIQAFLDIFPAACSTFHCHSFLNRLASFYEVAVPDIERAVRKRNFDDKSLQEDLWRRVCHTRRRMVEMAHLLLQHTCLQPILEGQPLSHRNIHIPLIGRNVSIHPTLSSDNNTPPPPFPPALDETRTSYLLQGVEDAWDSIGRRRTQYRPQQTDSSAGLTGQGAEGGAGAGAWGGEMGIREPGEGGETPRGAEAMRDTAGELESLLTHIRDLLPDLGEGFLLACLHQYNYSSELVINYILEDRLHPDLDKLDRAMPRPVKEELPPVLSTRSNVFDDDEFDVFNRDQVDMTRVWKGRRKGESVWDLLNDKQHIAEQKERYLTYETVVDEVIVTPSESGAVYNLDDYDDEYDDTYDINQVGANDLDGDSNLLNRRPFTVPQVLRQGGRPQIQEENVEEEEDEKDSAVKRDQFVQDPALLRERAEARRATMQHRKGDPSGPTQEGGPQEQGSQPQPQGYVRPQEEQRNDPLLIHGVAMETNQLT
uniref:Activating signal cointegrator 1 complex subunit 2 n=1 Tax=Hucho hucho TaxID=62062 RepID=A0A4W5KUD8_9TELE